MSSIARAILVALVAAILAFQVVRSAMVRQLPLGTAVWPGHPDVLLARTMAQIGAIAARGGRLPAPLLEQVAEVARKAPLAPEPFLVHGALAQMDRQERTAERLYLEARNRDPRSPAARYFLAERYLRTGRTDAALNEMAVLSRLTVGAGPLAPAIAAYARTSKAVEPLRRFFRTAPEFEQAVLAQLAADPANLDLILALWSGPSTQWRAEQSAWQAAIMGRLVTAGDYRRAYAAWRRFAGVRSAGQGVFNPEFREIPAPPPFNWTYGSAGGLANPGNGRLEVVYFGRDETVLAQQLLLLPPGRYTLGMQVSGDIQPAGGVAWTVECLPQKRSLLTLPVARKSSGGLAASFAVPQGCPAQQLQLTGSPGDFPRAVEFTLARFNLARASR